MSTANQDLQASHEIFTILKESKSLSDLILDHFPGIFMTIDLEGQILRGNVGVAKILGIDQEKLIKNNIYQLFNKESALKFKSSLEEAHSRQDEIIEFELPVNCHQMNEQAHLWQIARMQESKSLSATLFNIIGKDISQLKKAMSSLVTLEKDLEVTSAVQTLLLPRAADPKNQHFKIATYYQSASQAGGDWWWIDFRPTGELIALVGDVTGHGAGSAMVTALMAGGFITLNELRQHYIGTEFARKALEVLNHILHSVSQDSYWMPLSAVEILPATNQFRWWNAGAPSAYIVRSNSTVEVISRPGTPLGSKTCELGYFEGNFNPGDRFVLCTDGIYEFTQLDGNRFKKLKLKPLLSSLQGKDTRESCDSIIKTLKTLQGSKPNEDDATLVIIDRI